MRIAIVRGHSQDLQGAVNKAGSSEWVWSGVLGEQLAHKLHAHNTVAHVFERPTSGTYKQRMLELTHRVNAWRPDVVVSLHFNMSPNGEPWEGSKALHWPSSRAGRMWAVQLSGAASRAIGNRDRGAIGQAKSWARARQDESGQWLPDGEPLYILRDTVAPAVILEPYFGSSETDTRAATQARDSGALAQSLAVALTPVQS